MTTELLSRTHKFLECIESDRCISAFHSIPEPTKEGFQKAVAFQQGMVPLYRKKIYDSQRFFLGDIQGLPVLKHHIDTELLRLPFGETAFEYDWNLELPILHPEASGDSEPYSMFTAKRILCLCSGFYEQGETDDHIIEKVDNRILVMPLLLGKIDSTKLASFYSDDMSETSLLAGQDIALDYCLQFIIGISESNRIIFSPYVEPTILKEFRAQLHYQKTARALHTMIGEALCSTLVFMSCSNVRNKVVQIEERINRKRRAEGKVPFLSYRLLTLEPKFSKTHTKVVSDFEDPGFKRKSPVLHVRRGHFRRLENKRIWIHDMTVGSSDEGIRIKDYTVIFKKESA